MQCKSCQEEISSKFNHSISTNICPFCGQNILEEDLVIMLTELREVMSSTDKYKSEIFEWLKTNYGLVDSNADDYKALVEKAHSKPEKIKIDPTDVKLDDKGNQLTGIPQNQEATNVFFKRAQVKQQSIQDIVSKINKDKTSSSTGSFTTADFAAADQEDIEAYKQLMSEGVPTSIHSAIEPMDYDDNGEEPLPAIVEAFARGNSVNNTNGGYNARDVAKLQALQGKSSAAKHEMAKGGSVGLIRRS